MKPTRIHLIAAAATGKPFTATLGLRDSRELIQLFQEQLGNGFRVTGDERLLDATENDMKGGRTDDLARAAELSTAFADTSIHALLAIRGGAWMTRILPHINFAELRARNSPITLFGFSELTTLVNIVGASPKGLGILDMGPAFIPYGLSRRRSHAILADASGEPARNPPIEVIMRELSQFLTDIRRMLNGHPSKRTITARLVQGQLEDSFETTFRGGNLVVLSTLIGSRFDKYVRPNADWLILEEINEKPERIDRLLAHLTLAGFWKRCAGLLLGDFHRQETELLPAVLELLPYHLPEDRTMPVLVAREVGHVLPMAPLPVHSPMTVKRAGNFFTIAPVHPIDLTRGKTT